jgi:S1-C subfamily serine protease
MNKRQFILNLVFILAISLSAGFFISTKVYNDQWQDMMMKIEVLLEEKRFNLVEDLEDHNILTESMAYNLNNQIFLIAKEKKQIKGDILDQAYSKEDSLAYAIVITNDGWLVTNSIIKENEDLVVINNKNEIIDVVDVVHDPILGINYLKIDRTGLDPIAIINSDSLEIGDLVYAIKPNLYNYRHEIIPDSIRTLHARLVEKKSDLVYKPSDIIYGSLNNYIDDNLPLVNYKSQFIGFSFNLNNKTYLLPSKYIRYSLNNFFSGNDHEILYPSLGIEHIDLSKFVSASELPKKGAFVYNVIEKDSLLKKNDIIIKVENDEINELTSLNEILLEYKIGSEIKLTLVRNGEKIEIKTIIKGINK